MLTDSVEVARWVENPEDQERYLGKQASFKTTTFFRTTKAMKITLARALKLKNRLAGQLTKVGGRAVAHNSYVVGSDSPYDTVKVFAEYGEIQKQLVELKAKIQVANAPIHKSIALMGEFRTEIVLLNSMSVTKGTVVEPRYGEGQDTSRVYVAAIDKLARDNNVAELEQEIDILQDDIDAHNATTNIELTFDI